MSGSRGLKRLPKIAPEHAARAPQRQPPIPARRKGPMGAYTLRAVIRAPPRRPPPSNCAECIERIGDYYTENPDPIFADRAEGGGFRAVVNLVQSSLASVRRTSVISASSSSATLPSPSSRVWPKKPSASSTPALKHRMKKWPHPAADDDPDPDYRLGVYRHYRSFTLNRTDCSDITHVKSRRCGSE